MQPMMTRNQGRAVVDFLMAPLLLITLLIWWYSASQATPEAVQAVVAQANASPAATAIVQAGLKATPTPTVSELNTIRHQVEERLVLETAKRVTGDQSLRASSEVHAEQENQAQARVGETLLNEWLGWVLGIAVCLMLLLGSVALYGRLRDGPA
jgi:hypothetical protein